MNNYNSNDISGLNFNPIDESFVLSNNTDTSKFTITAFQNENQTKHIIVITNQFNFTVDLNIQFKTKQMHF